jgi:hypothetical protein
MIETIPGIISELGSLRNPETIDKTNQRSILGMANVMYTAISVFVAVYWVGGTISAEIGWVRQFFAITMVACLILLLNRCSNDLAKHQYI